MQHSTQRKYLVATLVAIAVLLGNQIFIQYWLYQKNKDAQLINVAGRQRMLSQKLTLEFYQFKEGKIPLSQIKETFEVWKATHQSFLKGNKEDVPKIESEKALHILENMMPQIDFIEKLIYQKALKVDAILLGQVSENQENFLQNMERVVENLEDESQSKLRFIVLMEIFLALLSLLIIVLEIAFIFKPISKKLQNIIQQMSSTENKLRAILNSTTESNILINKDFKIIEFNNKARKRTMLFYGKNIQIGQNLRNYLMEGLDENLTRNVRSALRGEGVSVEREMHFDNGMSHWFEISYFPAYNADKKIIGVSFNATDIDKRKRVELDIVKSNEKYAYLLNTLNGIVWEASVEPLAFTFMSQQAEDILGYPASIWLRSMDFWASFMHSEDREYALNYCRSKIKAGEDHYLEYRVRKADSTYVWLRDSVKVQKENGKVIKIYGLMIDITIQKQTEKSLIKNEQKTRRLLNITQSQNERLLNFTHIISHNLRSHVSNQLMLLSLVKEEQAENAQNEYFVLLQKATINLEETLSHLNQVVSINDEIILEELDLHEYAKKNLTSLKAEALKENCIVKNQIPQQTLIRANSAYLDSILVNLVSNAIKYKSSERQGKIILSIDKTSEFVVLNIKDNGLGIDLKKHGKKLFGMYKTFHDNKNARGIGLFITKNQIEAMGGKVEVESQVGKGSTFKVYLQHATTV